MDSPPKAVAPPARSLLETLIETERELAIVGEAGEREAEAVLAQARAEVAAADRAQSEALELELARFDEARRVEREAAVAAIEQEAQRAIARFRSLSEAEVARLAAQVVLEATGLAAEAAP